MKRIILSVAVFSSLLFGLRLAAQDSLSENSIKAAMDSAENDYALKATELIVALGFGDDLNKFGNNLKRFEETHPDFKDLLRGTALLSVSENLAALDRMEGTIGAFLEKHAGLKSYLAAVGTVAAIGMIKEGLGFAKYFMQDEMAQFLVTASSGVQQYLTLDILKSGGEFAVIAAIVVGISLAAYKGGTLLSERIWGKQVKFEDFLPVNDLNHSSVKIYCSNRNNPKQRDWLSEDEVNKVVGSWGRDNKSGVKGFATQESVVGLLSKCARDMRKKFNLSRLKPNDVMVEAGVSLANSKMVYGRYPIVYYSNFLNDQAQAVKLSHYFSK